MLQLHGHVAKLVRRRNHDPEMRRFESDRGHQDLERCPSGEGARLLSGSWRKPVRAFDPLTLRQVNQARLRTGGFADVFAATARFFLARVLAALTAASERLAFFSLRSGTQVSVPPWARCFVSCPQR